MARISLGICLMLVVASSVIYEAQGTFLLKHYLRKNFPRKCNEFTPFANKGMIMLVTNLESGCPATAEFKNFFANFKSYMTFIETTSATSKNVDVEMTTKAEGLFKAMSALSGGKGEKSADAGNFKVTMISMGKTLVEQKKNAAVMTIAQKKRLIVAMVKWTRMIATFVKTASEKKGKTINIASYGLDVDVNDTSIVGSTKTDTTSSTKTKTGAAASDTATASSNTKESSGSGSTSSKTESAGSGKAGSKESTKTESEASGKSGSKESRKTGSGTTFSDSTGAKSFGPSGSPTASPSGSTTVSGETSAKGSGSASSETKESKRGSASSEKKESKSGSTSTSSTTSVKQVETETSKEAMTFIMELEKKYSGKAELKVFFEKLKASMTAFATISSKTAKDYVSVTKSATGKLAEAMALVGSRNRKSAKMKSNMETCQEQLMKTLKELQDINSQIVTAKTVTSTQQTEIKQTITKWEQVTTQFVETAASSGTSSSSSSSESSATMVKKD